MRRRVQRAFDDGTAVMIGGTALAGLAMYVWQAAGTRILGAVAFAPVATVWTLMFLIITVLLAPVEQLATRTIASGPRGASQLRGALPAIGTGLLVATVGTVALTWELREALFGGNSAYVPICGAIVVGFGGLTVIRGIVAGQREFAAYGHITLGDSALRLLAGGTLLLLGSRSPLAYAWTIPLCSLVALGWLSYWPRRTGDARDGERVRVGRFMAQTMGGTIAAQTILASGPLALGLIGSSHAEVTTLFITQTGFRALFMVSLPGWSRALPSFTSLAVRGDVGRLNALRRGLFLSTLAAAVVSGIGAAVAAPTVLAVLFGNGSRPSAFVAGVCMAATVLAIGNLGLTQLLVASARTQGITWAWWVALAASAGVIGVVSASPVDRVVWSFLVGEVAALVALARIVHQAG